MQGERGHHFETSRDKVQKPNVNMERNLGKAEIEIRFQTCGKESFFDELFRKKALFGLRLGPDTSPANEILELSIVTWPMTVTVRKGVNKSALSV
jgi:hypothetical protein